jgi:hypothetical protein
MLLDARFVKCTFVVLSPALALVNAGSKRLREIVRESMKHAVIQNLHHEKDEWEISYLMFVVVC